MMQRRLMTIATIFALVSSPALACIVHVTYGPKEISHADMVFVGRATAIKQIEGFDLSIVTISVIEPLKGTMQESIDLLGPRFGFPGTVLTESGVYRGMPREASLFSAYVVNTETSDAREQFLREHGFFQLPPAAVPVDYAALPIIARPPCGYPFIQPATPDLIADVRKALAP
jgi:hypothetical protein